MQAATRAGDDVVSGGAGASSAHGGDTSSDEDDGIAHLVQMAADEVDSARNLDAGV